MEPINGGVVCIHGAINYLDVNYYKICKLLVESTYQLHVAFNFTMFHALPSHSWVLGMLEASCLLLSGLLYIYIILYNYINIISDCIEHGQILICHLIFKGHLACLLLLL